MASHLLLEGIDLSRAPKGSYIVEIGSVREPSAEPSSLYFSQKAKAYGLNFLTVDFSEESWKLARSYVGDQAIFQEGVQFLRGFSGEISVLYLDSFDFPYDAEVAKDLERRAGHIYAAKGESLTRGRSSQVHFEQYMAALAKMSTPSWMIVGDTFREKKSFKRVGSPFWGKGEKVVSHAIENGFVIMREGNKLSNGVLFFKSGERYSRPLRWLQRYCCVHRARPLYHLLGHPGFQCH